MVSERVVRVLSCRCSSYRICHSGHLETSGIMQTDTVHLVMPACPALRSLLLAVA
jgi:hypothetical protein